MSFSATVWVTDVLCVNSFMTTVKLCGTEEETHT